MKYLLTILLLLSFSCDSYSSSYTEALKAKNDELWDRYYRTRDDYLKVQKAYDALVEEAYVCKVERRVCNARLNKCEGAE